MSSLTEHWENYPKDYNFNKEAEGNPLVEMILSDNPESIVEFACGTGYIPYFLRKAGYKGRYVGTDIIQNFLEASREHNPKETFLYADLNEPFPFKDKEFDIAVIVTGLGYCKDYRKTLKELARITKRYIYTYMYNPFTDGEDNLRFLNGEGWGNQYNEEKFFKEVDKHFKVLLKNKHGDSFPNMGCTLKLEVK